MRLGGLATALVVLAAGASLANRAVPPPPSPRTPGPPLAAPRAHPASTPGGCSLSLGSMQFGRYDVLSDQPLDSSASVFYSCSGSAPAVLSVESGTEGTLVRRLTRGSASIRYNLYLDAARTQLWGDGTRGSFVHLARAGAAERVVIYGRVMPHQSLPPGRYDDTVVVRVTF